jgi:uncharacterized NAD(P)/FAD-binding protein YdhS
MISSTSTQANQGPRVPTVAIVGGGASGALVAAQLLRRHHRGGLRVVVIERRPDLGRGVAYSTDNPQHRLNVPAGQMGALPRDAGHFVRWARARGQEFGAPDFAPRGLYGEYLGSVLDDAERSSLPGVELDRRRDEAVSMRLVEDSEPPRMVIGLASGRTVVAHHLVLALGNLPPATPPGADPDLLASSLYERDPWEGGLPARTARDDKVLLVGTGLTMVDVALALGEQDRPGTILAVSRNGLLPQKHRRGLAPPNRWFELPPSDLRLAELVTRIESEIASAEQNGADWRQVIDALRPYTNRIWRRLSDEDREEFVRHLARRWDVARHRMAPEIARTLEVMRAEGRLRLARGSLESMRPRDLDVEVTMALGEGESTRFRVDRVINCTGPTLDLARAGEPLLESLLADGQVRPGPLGLGLDHDSRGVLLNSNGAPSTVLSTIGPMRKGRLWETTAMPEIRGQALELADQITAAMEASSARLASV